MSGADDHVWPKVPLGDLVLLKTGPFGSSLHKSDYEQDGTPVVNPMHIVKGRIAPGDGARVGTHVLARLGEFRLATGDVVLGRRGEMGRCAVVTPIEHGWLCGTGSLILRSRGAICAGYLQRFLSSPDVVTRLEDASVGSTMVNLNQSILRAIEVPLPPLPEQKRIADKLETLLARVDTCRNHLARVPAILKRFRQSVLTAATSGELTASWREEHGPRTQGGSDRLPPGWVWTSAEKIKANTRHSLAIGPFGSNLKVSDYTSAGVPLVFVREIRARSFGGLKTKFVAPGKAAELVAHAIQGGDLLITKMGDPPGDTAIYPLDAPDAIITADCIKLKVNAAMADAAYVAMAIECPATRERMQEITAGVAQQKISLERFRQFPLPLAPRAEQTEIVRRVESLFALADQLEARYTTARTHIDRLTPALLAKAFRGELVQQLPRGERASNSPPVRNSEIIDTPDPGTLAR